MNRHSAYLLIAISWTLAYPGAIAQNNGTQSRAQANKSIALGAGLPLSAPKMVLPKGPSVRLTRSARRKIKKSYPSSHYQKAMFFKQKNDKSHALVEFLKATQENPRLVKAYYEQALIFREKNYLKLAQSSLDQALAIKPDYQEARMLLATIQIQQGNVGAAMQQLGQSLGIKIATANGDNKNEEFPSPTVLQSLHMLLPENIGREVAKLPNRKSANSAKQTNKGPSKPEQKLSVIKGTSKSKGGATTNLSQDQSNRDSVVIAEPHSANQNDSAFAFHIPNPLHMLWPGDKSNETSGKDANPSGLPPKKAGQDQSATDSKIKVRERSNSTDEVGEARKPTDSDVPLDADHLPSLPPEEGKKQNSDAEQTSAKKHPRKQKKSWFSHFVPALAEEEEVPPPPPPIERAISTVTNGGASPIKPEPAADQTAQVETFDKPDEPRELAEKVSAMAHGAVAEISKIAKHGFQIPNLPSANSTLFSTLGTNGSTVDVDNIGSTNTDSPQPYKPQIAPNSDDPWSVRLRYLADHGTGTLKDGEAFMFSEESGEATLFLSDGQTVRRTIYLPRDAQEVVKQRRPDILTPDDLLYKLSLLAKLMPKANEQQEAQTQAAARQAPEQKTAPSNFEANDLMGKSQNFWGWLKGALKLDH